MNNQNPSSKDMSKVGGRKTYSKGVIAVVDLEEDDIENLKEKGMLYHELDSGLIELRLKNV